MANGENSVSIKEHFTELRAADIFWLTMLMAEKDSASNQRFTAQEQAIKTAEHSRDVAIKKAEDSIEKKSDAVYVKLTDLQQAFAEVMLRPEIQQRFDTVEKETGNLKTSRDESKGHAGGIVQSYQLLIGLAMMAVAIYGSGVFH